MEISFMGYQPPSAVSLLMCASSAITKEKSGMEDVTAVSSSLWA
jgi:hypothetical protein